MGGVLHAWRVTPEGDLELVPLEGERGVRSNAKTEEEENSRKALRSQHHVREKGLSTAEALEQARILQQVLARLLMREFLREGLITLELQLLLERPHLSTRMPDHHLPRTKTNNKPLPILA